MGLRNIWFSSLLTILIILRSKLILLWLITLNAKNARSVGEDQRWRAYRWESRRSICRVSLLRWLIWWCSSKSCWSKIILICRISWWSKIVLSIWSTKRCWTNNWKIIILRWRIMKWIWCCWNVCCPKKVPLVRKSKGRRVFENQQRGLV